MTGVSPLVPVSCRAVRSLADATGQLLRPNLPPRCGSDEILTPVHDHPSRQSHLIVAIFNILVRTLPVK